MYPVHFTGTPCSIFGELVQKIHIKQKITLGSKLSMENSGNQGSVAQWIRRLPTEQEIVGSSPA